MYNYVIFGTEADYHNIAINDIIRNSNVRYYRNVMDNYPSLLRLLHTVHFSTKIKFKPRFQSIWNSLYFNNDFDTKRPICFVFYMNQYRLKKASYFEYLRKKYPGCKLVLYFSDIVESYYSIFGDFNLDYINKTFDLVLSYNKLDVDKYGFVYYPQIMSKIKFNKNDIPLSDIFFVGADKGRLDSILKIYELMRAHDINCDFHITLVPQNKIKYSNEITYNKKMSYIEVLKRVQKTRCILELSQPEAYGFTMRTSEALLYNKKLLSNNPILKSTNYYDDRYIQYFKTIDEIDAEWILQEVKVDYEYEGEYSPQKLLEFLEVYFTTFRKVDDEEGEAQ